MRSPLRSEVDSPQGLYEYLTNLSRTIQQLENRPVAPTVTERPLTLSEIQRALSTGGTHPVVTTPVSADKFGILTGAGKSVTPQPAALEVFSETLPDANDYEIGYMVALQQIGLPDTLHYVVEGPPKAWTQVTFGGNFITTNTDETIDLNTNKTWMGKQHFQGSLRASELEVFDYFSGGESYIEITQAHEEITLSTVAAFTDSATIVLPTTGLILGVLTRVQQTISGGGVTTFSIGDSGNATRFTNNTLNLTVGNAEFGVNQWLGSVNTDAAGPIHVTGAPRPVRITCDAVPTQGIIRVSIFWIRFNPPTS